MTDGASGQHTASAGKWFVAIALDYNLGGFWDRDAGLLCQGFRGLGVDSKMVALGQAAESSDLPLILAPLRQLEQSDWWRQWGLEGVVVYSWALPRYTGMVRAMKKAGLKVVLMFDNDGLRGPQQWLWRYFQDAYAYERSRGRRFPSLVALARTLAFLPKSRHAGMLKHLECLDWVALQSPLALQRFSTLLHLLGRPDLARHLTIIHHPVFSGMIYDPGVAKKPLIIAVGGWHVFVKGAPLLVEALGLALGRLPEYRARVVGRGESELRRLISRLPADIQSRIEVPGPIDNKLLHRHYQEARIVVNTSYAEGFSIAGAEGLCCGCSVVGLASLSCFNYFCADSSGTLASKRSAGFYCDALCAEAGAWAAGQRDPARISALWTSRVHVQNVAAALLELATRPSPAGRASL